MNTDKSCYYQLLLLLEVFLLCFSTGSYFDDFTYGQCAYNSAKTKNRFHLWGSHWSHGDSLLFALACAQVIYMVLNLFGKCLRAFITLVSNSLYLPQFGGLEGGGWDIINVQISNFKHQEIELLLLYFLLFSFFLKII